MELTKYYELILKKLTGWSEDLIIMLPNFILALLALITFIFVGKTL